MSKEHAIIYSSLCVMSRASCDDDNTSVWTHVSGKEQADVTTSTVASRVSSTRVTSAWLSALNPRSVDVLSRLKPDVDVSSITCPFNAQSARLGFVRVVASNSQAAGCRHGAGALQSKHLCSAAKTLCMLKQFRYMVCSEGHKPPSHFSAQHEYGSLYLCRPASTIHYHCSCWLKTT